MCKVDRITKQEKIECGPQIFQVHPWAKHTDGVGGFMCPGDNCGVWTSPDNLTSLVRCKCCEVVFVPALAGPFSEESLDSVHLGEAD